MSKELLQKIRANLKRLNECSVHSFGVYDKPKSISHLRHKMTCQNCKGEMNIHDIVLYTKGYSAAGKDENDIIQNFFDS